MTDEDALQEVWALREETIFPRLFGSVRDGIYVLSVDIFTQRFRQTSIDPRWLFHGVLQFQPTETRNSWLYVTSGMSNPWEIAPDQYASQEYSGLGVEFVLEAPEQAEWPIVVLQNMMAYNILLSCELIGNGETMDYNDRIPLKSSISTGHESAIRNMIVVQPTHYADHFQLPSGRVDFLHFLGVTDAELNFAKVNGTDTLWDKLQDQHLTDPLRQSIL